MTMTDTEIDDGVDAGSEANEEGAEDRSVTDSPEESEGATPASSPRGRTRKAARATKAPKAAKAKGGKAKPPKVDKATPRVTKATPKTTLSTPISPAPSHLALYSAAQVARLVGDPTRLRILFELEGGEKNVGMIVRAIQMGQPAVSHHLTLLKLSGLVTPTRAGKHNIYALTPSGKMAWEFAKELIERQTVS